MAGVVTIAIIISSLLKVAIARILDNPLAGVPFILTLLACSVK